MELLNFIEPISLKACLIAILCGFIIGVERQWSGKVAGIRTSILICMSATIFVSLAHYYLPGEGTVRVIGQIVTGVGFLGAGVILSKDGLIRGVTSAAVIWVLAAIGSLIGLGHFITAIWISVLTVLVLVGLRYFEELLDKFKKISKRDYEE